MHIGFEKVVSPFAPVSEHPWELVHDSTVDLTTKSIRTLEAGHVIKTSIARASTPAGR